MHPMNLIPRAAMGAIASAMLIASCESDDRRLAEFAQRAADQQARQNERIAQQSAAMAQQSQEVAAAAHDLVEQDAAARRELFDAHDKLQIHHQAERAVLDRQREEVQTERKAAVQAAVRDPVIARAVIAGGLVLAALLPLLVTVYALRRLPERAPVDELLTNELLTRLTADRPAGVLADPTQALPEPTAPRLPASDE